jgi:hypothetical protein
VSALPQAEYHSQALVDRMIVCGKASNFGVISSKSNNLVYELRYAIFCSISCKSLRNLMPRRGKEGSRRGTRAKN